MATKTKPRRTTRQASLQDYQDSLQGVEVFPVQMPAGVRRIELYQSGGLEVMWAGAPELSCDDIDDDADVNLILFFGGAYAIVGTSWPARLQDLLTADTLCNFGMISRLEAEKINAWRNARKLQLWKNKLAIAQDAIEKIEAKLREKKGGA